MTEKEINREQRYLTKTKNKISNALMREKSLWIHHKNYPSKEALEQAFKDDLQKALKGLNIVDVYILQNDNGYSKAFFAIIEDDKYQYQAARLPGKYEIMAETTFDFLKVKD